MFCPKCKYTTFDYLRACPKCGYDWEEIRKELCIDWFNKKEAEDLKETGSQKERLSLSRGEDNEEIDFLNEVSSPILKKESMGGEELEVPMEEPLLQLNSSEEEPAIEGFKSEDNEKSNIEEKDNNEVVINIPKEKEAIELEDFELVQEDVEGEISVDFIFQSSNGDSQKSSKRIKREEEREFPDKGIWSLDIPEKDEDKVDEKDIEGEQGADIKTDKQNNDIELLDFDIIFEEKK